MRLGEERRGRMLRRIVISFLLCALLLAGACSAEYSLAKGIRRQIIYPAVAVVVGLVVIIAAVSDVEAAADGGADFDCAVTNNTGQAFELRDGGRPLGVIEPGETVCFALGAGAHELSWRPLEYGAEYYDLRTAVEIPDGRSYLPIALEPR